MARWDELNPSDIHREWIEMENQLQEYEDRLDQRRYADHLVNARILRDVMDAAHGRQEEAA